MLTKDGMLQDTRETGTDIIKKQLKKQKGNDGEPITKEEIDRIYDDNYSGNKAPHRSPSIVFWTKFP